MWARALKNDCRPGNGRSRLRFLWMTTLLVHIHASSLIILPVNSVQPELTKASLNKREIILRK
jgi:hypothetical protein